MAQPSFPALRQPVFRAYFFGAASAMMADSIEHVISYWIMFQKFQSPALAGFAVISHWVPFILFSLWSGALADRYDPRRIIQIGMTVFMAVSVGWGVLFLTDTLEMWHAVVLLTLHGLAGVLWNPAAQLFIHDIVEDKDLKPGQPRLLEVDNPLVVPVNTTIRVQVTGVPDGVIHSWFMPSFGVQEYAMPGRLNESWIRVGNPGTYYGECNQICGINHSRMPIEVKAVSRADFQNWLAQAKKNAGLAPDGTTPRNHDQQVAAARSGPAPAVTDKEEVSR